MKSFGDKFQEAVTAFFEWAKDFVDREKRSESHHWPEPSENKKYGIGVVEYGRDYNHEYLRSILEMDPHRRRALLQGDPSGFQKINPNELILQQQKKTRAAIESMLNLMSANFADPGFSVYNRNNELVAKVDPEHQDIIRQVLVYLLEEGLTLLQQNNLEDVAKYHELLNNVQTKVPGESRHQTALRYICEAERKFKREMGSQQDMEP